MSSLPDSPCRLLPFASIASHANLRCDAKYRLFWGITGDTLYPDSIIQCQQIRLATLPCRFRKLKKGVLAAEYEIIELEDVEKRTGTILSSSMSSELNSDKLVFGDADVLTTRLRPYLGKTILNDKKRALAGTTEWIPLKVNASKLHPKLLKYFLLSPVYVNNAERLLSGKEHPRVAESDILALKVPVFDDNVQIALVTSIEKIEQEIAAYRSSIRDEDDIINEILCAAFKYPLEEYRSRVRAKWYVKPFASMTESFTLRGSARFHHPDFELTRQFFQKGSHSRLKSWLRSPIRLGATVSRAELLADGAAYYVHPGATKRESVIDLEDCYEVSGEYYNANRRASLRPGDIIINRSGEALGKVALFNSEAPAIASDFTMRVRVNAKTRSLFAWYFFRSIMFQTQIARELRGSSMPNIFPPQVQQMSVVNCSTQMQESLAEQVYFHIDQVHQAREKVQKRQQEIHTLIAATCSSG
jgi:restriction endonuclease S subunit